MALCCLTPLVSEGLCQHRQDGKCAHLSLPHPSFIYYFVFASLFPRLLTAFQTLLSPSLPSAPLGVWVLPPPVGLGHPSPYCDNEDKRRVRWKRRLHAWNSGHTAFVPVTHLTWLYLNIKWTKKLKINLKKP